MNDKKSDIRVAQVLAGAPIGGAENFYTRLVTSLAENKGIKQCAFTRPNEWREAQFKSAGVPVSLHRLGGKLDLWGRFQYQKALKKWQPDIVMTYMNRATFLTPRGDYKLVARLGHYYDLKYYQHCDYWVGITKGICDYMVQNGFPSERVFHIPNFVDETIVEPLPRTSFETPEGVPLLLAAGRLHVNKGFDTLLRALVDVPDAILWLAGDGPEEANLKKLAEELGVLTRVRFLGWRRDVNALMRTVDLFVCPSRHEGLGSIVPEAWFNQCPIVATRSQGPSELIEHGKTGMLSKLDESEELKKNIIYLISSVKFKNKLVKAGVLEYRKRYSKDIICNMYYKLYRDLED